MAYAIVDAGQLDAGLTAISDAIRGKTGGTEPLRFPEGMASEMDVVFEAGKKAEYDAFWDCYQENGDRTSYSFAFGGWKDALFLPKYDMNPRNCQYMFAKSSISSLTNLLTKAGVILDDSKCENHIGMYFEATELTEVPPLDLRNSLYATNIFNFCVNLKRVELKVAENTVPNYSGWFYRCDSLEDLSFNGVLDKGQLELQWSTKLSRTSIVSVVDALSAMTTGLTATLSLAAVNTAFETAEGAADGSTAAEWAALIDTKSNWTISLS